MSRHTVVTALLLALGVITACTKPPEGAAPEYFSAPPLTLSIPKLAGWMPDPNIKVNDAASGGIVLRLVRESAVAGSPRVDVVWEPTRERASILEEFLTRNLREMAALEQGGQIHIQHVDQRSVQLGASPAWRVHHEYSLGSGNAQVSINQVSTFVVIDGRGVAVTAAGRTELFHPLARQIEGMLDGLVIPGEKTPASGGTLGPSKRVDMPSSVEPVDLGKIGGVK